ncbi:MAG: hypothetical protein FJX40_14885 [Alphaproteobacteria bacterium]|nr:hypothetical protein [Alphaproteobacteria bacterium]
MSANALQAVLDRAAREEETPAHSEQPVAARKVRKLVNAPKPQPAAEPVESEPRRKFFRPSRDNRRFIGGHFTPAVGKQLRLIAVEDDTTVQALLEEALDLLFVKKGRQKIVDLAK